jgi:hypothetical protein
LDQLSFIAVCGLVLLTVFALLSVLALSMWAITLAFPEQPAGLDAALVAAVASAVSSVAPGSRLVRIEEIPCSSPRAPRRSA